MDWIIVPVILVVIIVRMAWTYFDLRRVTKLIDNAKLESVIHASQLTDVREAGASKTKHTIGVRNLPASQIQLSMSATHEDKPVLSYGSSRSLAPPRVIRTPKKAGYTNLYVLKDGFDYWTGRAKEG